MHLIIAQYTTHTETIKTNNPEEELNMIIQKSIHSLISIILDGKIVYTKPMY